MNELKQLRGFVLIIIIIVTCVYGTSAHYTTDNYAKEKRIELLTKQNDSLKAQYHNCCVANGEILKGKK